MYVEISKNNFLRFKLALILRLHNAGYENANITYNDENELFVLDLGQTVTGLDFDFDQIFNNSNYNDRYSFNQDIVVTAKSESGEINFFRYIFCDAKQSLDAFDILENVISEWSENIPGFNFLINQTGDSAISLRIEISHPISASQYQSLSEFVRDGSPFLNVSISANIVPDLLSEDLKNVREESGEVEAPYDSLFTFLHPIWQTFQEIIVAIDLLNPPFQSEEIGSCVEEFLYTKF